MCTKIQNRTPKYDDRWCLEDNYLPIGRLLGKNLPSAIKFWANMYI